VTPGALANGWIGSALGLLSLLAMGLALALGLATWYVARRLRHPPRRTAAWAIAKGVASDPGEMPKPRAFTSWTVSAVDGPLRGVECPVWDIEGDNPSGPVVVLTPGWGDSRVGALVRVAALAAHCSRLICWDSPGLGEAPGACPLGTKEHATLRALVDRIDGDRPVVLHGWSMGAGTSLLAAVDNHRIAGVIAEAPYRLAWEPAFAVLEASGLPWRINGRIAFALLGLRLGVGPAWKSFDRAAVASGVRAPLLVLHGDTDALCPIADGEAIAQAAVNGRLRAIAGVGHNDLWTDERFRAQSEDACADFLLAYG
jgi:pimeloyl-ACP methyl ester carboxylesterase